jgi:hypothetical protein
MFELSYINVNTSSAHSFLAVQATMMCIAVKFNNLVDVEYVIVFGFINLNVCPSFAAYFEAHMGYALKREALGACVTVCHFAPSESLLAVRRMGHTRCVM